MKQICLGSERLILRPFSISDAERVVALVGNYHVSKFLQHVPYPYSLNDAKEWIASHESGFYEGSRITYAITLKQSEALIGAIGLINIQNREASMGYWLGESYWGKGYATEAVSLIFKFAEDEMKLLRVYAEHLTINPASGIVMQKNKMKHIGQRTVQHRDQGERLLEIYEVLFNADCKPA